ncbi:MAG: class II aldolase/adducin family protein [Kineosporiaceae bacterium]|nr:class II aldolase/adducin family protein [Kineosporiaceae bacterium]
MNETWSVARELVITFARKLQAERLVYSTSGNLSCRVSGSPHLVAVTPTAMEYDLITPDDVPIVALAAAPGETGESGESGEPGGVVDGRRAPTSEWPLHAGLYARPEIGAVVHTHGKAVMTMANLGWRLPPILTGLCEATGGDVLTSPYARPGTPALVEAVRPALRERGATFLRYHGLLAYGADLPHAFHTAAVVEGACEVYLALRAHGEVHELPAEEVEYIAGFWRAQFASPPGAPQPGIMAR